MNLNYLRQMSVFKTIWINFKIFPLKTAIKMPLIIGRHSYIKIKRGGVQIDEKVKPGMIAFGVGGSPDLLKYEAKKNYLCVQNGGRIVFKGKAHFSTHTSILAIGATIEFGSDFGSNVGCRFSAVEGITFGKKCLLGGSCVVRDSDGHRVFDCDNDGNKSHEHNSAKQVSIGDHVWIANNSSILKGVCIDSDNIVAYGSIVVKSIEGNYQIIAGSPAKVVKKNVMWQH